MSQKGSSMEWTDIFLRDGKWIKQDENCNTYDVEVHATFGPGWTIVNSGTIQLNYRSTERATMKNRPESLTEFDYYRIHVTSGKITRVEYLYNHGWSDVDFLMIEAGADILKHFKFIV